jgi:hypothetical protein
MITKQIKKRETLFIEFSEEEMEELGISVKDKFVVKTENDNIVLEKFKTIEIDLEEFSKEDLMYIIEYAHEKDITFEDAFSEILKEVVDYLKNEK